MLTTIKSIQWMQIESPMENKYPSQLLAGKVLMIIFFLLLQDNKSIFEFDQTFDIANSNQASTSSMHFSFSDLCCPFILAYVFVFPVPCITLLTYVAS